MNERRFAYTSEVSMRTILIGALLIATQLGASGTQPAPTPYPGFSCKTLAHRQPLASAPGTTFRVLRLTFAPNFVPLAHTHKYGEILYLLSGSATDTVNGKAVPFSTDAAIVIPAGTVHLVKPGASGVTMLSVQFGDTKSPEFRTTMTKDTYSCKD